MHRTHVAVAIDSPVRLTNQEATTFVAHAIDTVTANHRALLMAGCIQDEPTQRYAKMFVESAFTTSAGPNSTEGGELIEIMRGLGFVRAADGRIRHKDHIRSWTSWTEALAACSIMPPAPV